MTYNPGSYRGFYAPVPYPFPCENGPALPPDQGNLVSLSFNEDYLPFLQGALKVWAREESWVGAQQDVGNCTAFFMQLLLTEPTTFIPPPPNWYAFPTYSGQYFKVEFETYVQQTAADPGLLFSHAVWSGVFDGAFPVTMGFYDFATSNPVGVNIDELAVESFDVSNAMNLNVTYCLGDPYNNNFSLPFGFTEWEGVPQDNGIRSITITPALEVPFYVFVLGSQDWLCGPA